jgi:DNA anti-recombination protein RmuC
MKIIKFFSFALLLSLLWVACKDANTSNSTEESALTAEVLANKAIAVDNLNQIKTAIASKITELEKAMVEAEDAVKTELNTQVENFRKHESELQELTNKVVEATDENWTALSIEIDNKISAAKIALTGTTPETGVSPTGQNN